MAISKLLEQKGTMFKHFSKIILHCIGHPFVAQDSFCLKEPLWLYFQIVHMYYSPLTTLRMYAGQKVFFSSMDPWTRCK